MMESVKKDAALNRKVTQEAYNLHKFYFHCYINNCGADAGGIGYLMYPIACISCACNRIHQIGEKVLI